jgi:hypothetical protein
MIYMLKSVVDVANLIKREFLKNMKWCLFTFCKLIEKITNKYEIEHLRGITFTRSLRKRYTTDAMYSRKL